MKLYTYTMQRSLPRLALKGMPPGFWFSPDMETAFEWMSMDSENPKDPPVMLEVDSDGLEEYFGVDGGVIEDYAVMASEDAESEGAEDPDTAYEKVYLLAEELDAAPRGKKWIQTILENFDGANNMSTIPARKVTVLRVKDMDWPDGLDKEPKIEYSGPPQPLTAFKQPLVTRLLRSIFLPKHKLYGAGRPVSASMGFISKFFPRGGADDDMPPPDVVSGVPLVWAAGKTFQRGMNGAFGQEAGGAIRKLVELRLGAIPGKLLGSGAKGAAYVFGPSRAVKVTMDGNELQAAANLIGVQHPNLAMVHDVFIVSDGQKGAGIILRDAVDTTLNKYDRKLAEQLNSTMDEVLESTQKAIGDDVGRIQDISPKILAEQVGLMVELLRQDGCDLVEAALLMDLADAFRMLAHYGILGIDFDAMNVGVIKKPSPRLVLFDYGMTQSPPAQVEVVTLKGVEI